MIYKLYKVISETLLEVVTINRRQNEKNKTKDNLESIKQQQTEKKDEKEVHNFKIEKKTFLKK